jgi:hypothetical protein
MYREGKFTLGVLGFTALTGWIVVGLVALSNIG